MRDGERERERWEKEKRRVQRTANFHFARAMINWVSIKKRLQEIALISIQALNRSQSDCFWHCWPNVELDNQEFFPCLFFLFSRVYALSMELKDSAIQISISIHTNPQVLPKVPNICQKIVLKQTRAKEHFVRFVFIYWGILFVSTIITIYKVVRNIAKTGNVGLWLIISTAWHVIRVLPIVDAIAG